MSISDADRQTVRMRAALRCEYCGVSEQDTGGELTIDHFCPKAHGGTDDLINLLYCCHRCNEYKADYWPQQPQAQMLWNPRVEAASDHFVLLANGTLYAYTPRGTFTIQRLRLNRPGLLTYRQQQTRQTDIQHLFTQLREIVGTMERLQQQHSQLLQQQQSLLEEQRILLKVLLQQRNNKGY